MSVGGAAQRCRQTSTILCMLPSSPNCRNYDIFQKYTKLCERELEAFMVKDGLSAQVSPFPGWVLGAHYHCSWH